MGRCRRRCGGSATARRSRPRSPPTSPPKERSRARRVSRPDQNQNEKKAVKEEVRVVEVYKPVRRRLSDTRAALTHKFSIEGHECYITVGLFEDGTPGELFISMAKEGSTLSGMLDAYA